MTKRQCRFLSIPCSISITSLRNFEMSITNPILLNDWEFEKFSPVVLAMQLGFWGASNVRIAGRTAADLGPRYDSCKNPNHTSRHYRE